MRGGRGSGKTRCGAESLAELIETNPPGEWGLVAPTYMRDAVRVCVESDSGLLRALGNKVSNWNRSQGEIKLGDGGWVFVDSAEGGAARVQGQNLRGCWCDEAFLWGAEWRKAWNESIRYAVRHEPAATIVTGTPKVGHGLIRELEDAPNVVVSVLRTIDNVANLSADRVAELYDRYSDTRLGAQELEGAILDEFEGALWTPAHIDPYKVESPPTLVRTVIGVDPSTGTDDMDLPAGAGKETGIVVAGLSADRHVYILDDLSCRVSTMEWARRACEASLAHGRATVVPEVNLGKWVPDVIRAQDQTVPLHPVRAADGKRARAEPVAALYEKGRVHHVGRFELLEGQMVTWDPTDTYSPDRIDALVWAVFALNPWAGGGPAVFAKSKPRTMPRVAVR